MRFLRIDTGNEREKDERRFGEPTKRNKRRVLVASVGRNNVYQGEQTVSEMHRAERQK
jgi:hypothetical protein